MSKSLFCTAEGSWFPGKQALKVKIKSLAEEAKIIRLEEKRAPCDVSRSILRGA